MNNVIKTFVRSREAQLIAAMLVMVAAIASRFPAFITPTNLAAVFNDTSILIILAFGQMAVILTRCIDLSIAANLALCGMVAALINVAAPGLSLAVILPLTMLLGAALGAINGLLVWKLDIPSIVVTLGTMTIFRGTIFLLTNGAWVNAHEMSEAFKSLPRADLLGLPVLSWFAIVIIAIIYVLYTRTPFGRSLYAIGGNPVAAVYVGIDVGKIRFFAFMLSGALAGLAGYLWVSRYAVSYVDIAAGFELDVVAACVIGGISISGGIGSVGGAVLGALFLGIVKNALPVIHVSPFWQMAISGIVIIIAVALNARAERKKGRIILKSAEAKS
jgi:rhamnose transport system permease protein